jgi:polyisoprenoid-binding protein YceI
MKQLMASLLMTAGIALSACSAPSTTPTAIDPPATAQPTSAAATAPPPTAAPTTPPPPTTAPTLAPTATQPPTAAATAAQGVRLVVEGSQSEARYRAREQLLGRNLPSDAIGTSKTVSGRIVLGASGEPLPEQSQISVDLTALQSDERRRDNFIKQDTLQTSRFPSATFVAREVEGLPTPIPTSGDATFKLSGELTVHGVTRPVTWQVTATFSDTAVSGTATTKVNISDFGMTPPKAGPVLSIEDELTLELAFAANREA